MSAPAKIEMLSEKPTNIEKPSLIVIQKTPEKPTDVAIGKFIEETSKKILDPENSEKPAAPIRTSSKASGKPNPVLNAKCNDKNFIRVDIYDYTPKKIAPKLMLNGNGCLPGRVTNVAANKTGQVNTYAVEMESDAKPKKIEQQWEIDLRRLNYHQKIIVLNIYLIILIVAMMLFVIWKLVENDENRKHA